MNSGAPAGEQKSPVELAFELLVYAPLGLVFTAREELPRLIDKGRQGAAGQIGMARVVGQFAVQKGQKEAEQLLRKANERLGDLGLSDRRRPGEPSPRPATEPAAAGTAPPVSSASPGAHETAPSPATSSPAGPAGGASAESLAIPGYDSLSATQVVQRLDGLSADELEAVRAYEAATRGRKTILGRVAQLQSAS